MTTPTTTREAEVYAAEVRRHLDDLTEEERSNLLEDLEQHLADVGAEASDSESDLHDLLGDPGTYAAELRSAAGLPPRPSSAPSDAAQRSWVGRLRSVADHRSVRAAKALAKELAPAWWVIRGALVVGLIVASSQNRWQHVPIPQVLGSPVLGLLTALGAVAASVYLGRRGYRGWSRAVLLADAFIAISALVLLLELTQVSLGLRMAHHSGPTSVERSVEILESPHGPVTNIYPYDSQGRPLEGVLLYDQDGRPLRSALQHWWADGCERKPAYPLAADGVPVEFSYPLNYTFTFSFEAFGPASEAELQRQRQTFEQRCEAQIPRPVVPIPTFPAAPAPAEGPQPTP